MLFITILTLSAAFIAGAAAFFSVYGLAATFNGVFWSVVLMGSSLELGKLVAASYLYRYWTKTNIWLKTYLMAGILTLMILTSTGIFGYLSSGYQTDVLPLKQVEEQVKMMEGEKTRLLDRKTAIDTQISQLPTNSTRGRIRLMNGFKQEQKDVTKRISELDKIILEQKTKLIQTQAHVGPITYIASAMGLDTDNATKYLIYIIIFAFDPMAVALTLAVNIAIRLRKEEQDALKPLPVAELVIPTPEPVVVAEPEPELEPLPEPEVELPAEPEIVKHPEPELLLELEPLPEPLPEPEPEVNIDDINSSLRDAAEEIEYDVNIPEEPIVEEVVEAVIEEPVAEEIAEEPVAVEEPAQQPVHRRVRPYGAINGAITSQTKINELLQHHKWLKDKQASGEPLSQDDRWELSAIEEILRKQDLGLYLS
jgi:hypothetical protein